MTLYECGSCRQVRTADDGCRVCGSTNLSAISVGSEDHVCAVCGDSFGSLGALRSHGRVHEDEDENEGDGGDEAKEAADG
jgi:RNA polymerase subunit RPABC4/transcription elongation factor Spt4